MNNGHTIFPLGDSAATIDLGNTISESLNDKIIAMQQWMLANSFAGQKDIIVAYSSLTIIYDPVVIKNRFHPATTVFSWVKEKLITAFEQSIGQPINEPGIIRIPVCYADAYAMDLNNMAEEKSMSKQEIIDLHTAATYRVYTIGFLPGFSYMAEVHEKLITPRKIRPVPVAAGSIGIAGVQTGIYPLNSPGGWHIIGRTPVKQFNADTKELVKLKVGDRVQFYSISDEKYGEIADFGMQ
ncbi:MAG: 5-oxoprolinase subunit PxpB [Chitinophagaceae bacterium]